MFISFKTALLVIRECELVKNGLWNELHNPRVKRLRKRYDMVKNLHTENLHVLFVVFGFKLIVHKSQFLPNRENLRITGYEINGHLLVLELSVLLLESLEVLLEVWVLLKQHIDLAQVLVGVRLRFKSLIKSRYRK